jgi:hypothetical protein
MDKLMPVVVAEVECFLALARLGPVDQAVAELLGIWAEDMSAVTTDLAV